MFVGEFTPTQTEDLKRAVRRAEDDSELRFSLYVGPAEGEPRAHAERLHGELADPPRSVMVFCDPEERALEIVTGAVARRTLEDGECALTALSMKSSFEGGDIAGGLAKGLIQLGRAARAPRTLHVTPPDAH